MKLKSTISFTILFFLCSVLFTQQAIEKSNEVAIRETALDYADGYYSGDSKRMEQAVHPDFNKVIAVKLQQTGRYFLSYSTVSELIKMTGAKVGLLEEDKRKIEISILLVDENTACVKLKSAMFNDYLQMVNFEGQWKIVNVLWTTNIDSTNQLEENVFNANSEKEKIRTTIKEYYTGLYTHDIERIKKAIHPELNFVKLKKLSQTGELIISRYGQSFTYEIVRAKLLNISDDKKSVKINILDIMDGMAFVEAVSSFSKSYYQLQLFDDSWKIINVLSKQI